MASAAASGPPQAPAAGSTEARRTNPFLEFQVVVLAGGSSSRLSSLTGTPKEKGGCSKALLPVGNRPMLWYCLKNLQESRFGDAIVLTRQEEQAEILAYLRQEFPNAFQRLEVIGLGRDRDAEKGKKSEDGEDDFDDDVVCGTAEALMQIKHLLVTDFFVITCDVIGPVDFFSLANLHRVENAACSVYLLRRDYLSEGASEILDRSAQGKGGKGGKKKAASEKVDKDANKGNPVAIAFEETETLLLGIQDRHSISHGAQLAIPKLTLFYHPSVFVKANLYDPHVYLFKLSALKILEAPKLRHTLTSIRFDLVPYMSLMQMTPQASLWSASRLDCDVFDELLDSFDEPHKNEKENSSREQDYTLANRPEQPRKGNKVVFALHPDCAGICCRVNNIHDYYEMNMKFCSNRMDELRGIMPEWMLPGQQAKKYPTMRDSNVAEGSTFDESAVVKRSVLGPEVTVGPKTRVTASILLEGAKIEEGATVQRCIVGRKATIGKDCKLTNCQVRHGYSVPPGTVAEDEVLPVFADDA
ncbi:putative eukaryotic initiation factor-2B gamma subunit [Neospora caninum Liverpool]|uniref:Translation initiation factor eIF2B subunit gamma n=1 Tax=Neospora caninum (strain Liverpool) TaxID=572307 RepID=F0VPC1_NEOCL|nr:putative eukaryotic initiation factor-2B gamma subunit [Neospora caninum Liverpool]CBZ55567.1 putative eukaryotic initiation factor-2B gamma subunit [Neospora caninum Liverpool]CEL70309.1 TPA: eukaryotic initiation factor-2B gamma subunit,putative [Neospora caninum Liverpool]|eukprot:XP_003885595.1 putative eukaryotic initiation factor-2B gamma subunit [Neospora caninum Liverpool]